jgi:DNA processing protein
MRSLVCGDPEFPARLAVARPTVSSLWVNGRVPSAGDRTIGIVGSRAASGAGVALARALATALAADGHSIVSGGAFGVDAAAHLGALDANGATYAVLGCGIDVVYPDRHAKLFTSIARAGGGLLSEYGPGTPPRHAQFPARNRLIAALSDAVIVIEAAHRSGALTTAAQARRYGRLLCAVPGSAGADRLVASGHAVAVRTVEDVRDALAGRRVAARVAADESKDGSPSSIVVAALAARPDHPAGVARRVGLPLPAVMAALAEAELDGRLRRRVGGQFEVSGGN